MITKLSKVFLILLFILAGSAIAEIVANSLNPDKIPPRVYLDGKDVSFQSLQQIQNQYEKKKAQLADKLIIVKAPDLQLSLRTNELNPDIDLSEFSQSIKELKKPFSIIERVKLYTGVERREYTSKLSYSKEKAKDILVSLKDKFNQPAKDAKFVFENGRVKTFSPEKSGKAVDEEKFWSDLEKLMKNFASEKNNQYTISVNIKEVQPKVKLKDLNTFGIQELIAVGKSDFKGSAPSRKYNIILGSSRINGVIVPKGGVFSFNEAIGDISAATGYKQSYIIKNGRTVLGDGGGVCQISTTVFRAALNAGLPIVERKAHSYRVTYYENDAKPGLDATVFDPLVDLKFKNDTDAAILIQTEVDEKNDLLYVYIYGKKDNREVFLSDIKVWDEVPPPPPAYIEDPNLPAGVKKQIDFAAWGAKSKYDYKVVKDGKVIYEKTFLSVYRPWRAVFLVGTGG